MLWGAAALTGVGGYRLERENAELDTFPKHLIANARRFGARAAMRHKDYGIWQSWTWAEQLEEIRSFSVALTLAGLKSGDKVHWRFVEDAQVPYGPWKKYGGSQLRPTQPGAGGQDLEAQRRYLEYLRKLRDEEFKKKPIGR